MKGKVATVGSTRVSQNGYHYTKTSTGWVLTHYLIASKKLGRELAEDERCKFIDGNRRNLDPSNIAVIRRGKASLRRRRAVIEARLEELQAELNEINLQLQE